MLEEEFEGLECSDDDWVVIEVAFQIRILVLCVLDVLVALLHALIEKCLELGVEEVELRVGERHFEVHLLAVYARHFLNEIHELSGFGCLICAHLCVWTVGIDGHFAVERVKDHESAGQLHIELFVWILFLRCFLERRHAATYFALKTVFKLVQLILQLVINGALEHLKVISEAAENFDVCDDRLDAVNTANKIIRTHVS